MKNYKIVNVLSLAFVGLLFVGIIVLFALNEDRQVQDAQLTGRIWTGSADGEYYTYNITKEERAYREQIGFSGRYSVPGFRTVSYTRFRLEARGTPKGTLLKRVLLDDIVNAPNGSGPDILGPVPGGVWIWNHGMELRDTVTLEARFTAKQLRELNPSVAGTFPDDEKDAKVSAPHEALIFKSTDLQYYAVNTTTGKVALADPQLLKDVTSIKTMEDGFRYVQPMGKSLGSTSVNDFLISSFGTPANQWFALLSEEKRDGLTKWPLSNDRPYGESWRMFYGAEYKVDDRNQIEIVPEDVEQIGDLKLLNGAFLQRGANSVWNVPDPSSVLVLHKKDLKKDSPWQVGRLSKGGKLIWDINTGIADLHTVSDAGETVVFYGFKNNTQPLGERPDTLVFVNTITGAVSIQGNVPVSLKDSPKFRPWPELSKSE